MAKFLFNGREYYMDGYLDNTVNLMEQHINKDNDILCIIDGATGTGKSCLAQQLAGRIDPTFDVSRACFDADEFKKAIINAKKKQAIIFDEALNGLNIRRTMSSVNVTMTSLLTEIRQKNLVIIMCLPSIFDLDKSIAIHRSQFLIHVYMKNGKRGFFRFYGKKAKARLFGNDFARRTYQYIGRSTFWGSFKNGYVIDEESYRKKKDDVLKKYLPTDTLETPSIKKKTAEKDKKAQFIINLKKSKNLSYRELEVMGLGDRKELSQLVRGFQLRNSGGEPIYSSANVPVEREILEQEE